MPVEYGIECVSNADLYILRILPYLLRNSSGSIYYRLYDYIITLIDVECSSNGKRLIMRVLCGVKHKMLMGSIIRREKCC